MGWGTFAFGAPGWFLGAVFLAGAVVCTLRSSRMRSRADLLRTEVPTSLDVAVATLGTKKRSKVTVFAGRLGAVDPVSSPGGVLCAFYEAEVREIGQGGEKGVLLSRDQGASLPVVLKGERTEVPVEFSREDVIAPLRIRRCRWAGLLGSAAEQPSHPGIACADALSFERVGKLNERCLVVGRLVREGNELRLQGPGVGPVLLAMDAVAPLASERLVRKSWALFAGAAGLSCASALFFAQAR
jgi:hypothetical protein